MRTTLSGLANRTELGRPSNIGVVLILLAVGLCSVLHSIARPFWYDEICTVILCRLPSASEIWKALANAADTNPPVFYLVSRLARKLVSDDHLGYRLPSILGLLATVFCVYVILSKRVGHLSALVGATFVLSTPLAGYGYEARPYALVLGCISGAILAWQRIDDSRLYAVVVAIALGAAVSLHYYAILVWPALLLAETSVWIFRRRFRISAWAALFVGALPLLLFAPLLLKLRQYYGQGFWAKPSMKQIYLAQAWLFPFGPHSGLFFAAGITAIFLYVSITKTARRGESGHQQVEVNVLPIEEQTLTLMLLWLPVLAVVIAKVSHGGMTERYMLPTILGGAMALGYVMEKTPSAGRMLVLILLLINYASSNIEVVRMVLNGSLLEARASATRELKTIVGQSDLPVVISSGLAYLPMAYYTPTDSDGKLFAIADPHEAATYANTDSVDLALLALQRYFPLRVEDYVGFVSRHKEFLLVAGGSLEWLPACLVHDGYNLKLVSTGETTVYKVTMSR
jgi:4-amino-4-deoxy-L-arabinose transferase-like glycosyltransferase